MQIFWEKWGIFQQSSIKYLNISIKNPSSEKVQQEKFFIFLLLKDRIFFHFHFENQKQLWISCSIVRVVVDSIFFSSYYSMITSSNWRRDEVII